VREGKGKIFLSDRADGFGGLVTQHGVPGEALEYQSAFVPLGTTTPDECELRGGFGMKILWLEGGVLLSISNSSTGTVLCVYR